MDCFCLRVQKTTSSRAACGQAVISSAERTDFKEGSSNPYARKERKSQCRIRMEQTQAMMDKRSSLFTL